MVATQEQLQVKIADILKKIKNIDTLENEQKFNELKSKSDEMVATQEKLQTKITTILNKIKKKIPVSAIPSIPGAIRNLQGTTYATGLNAIEV